MKYCTKQYFALSTYYLVLVHDANEKSVRWVFPRKDQYLTDAMIALISSN